MTAEEDGNEADMEDDGADGSDAEAGEEEQDDVGVDDSDVHAGSSYNTHELWDDEYQDVNGYHNAPYPLDQGAPPNAPPSLDIQTAGYPSAPPTCETHDDDDDNGNQVS